MVLTGHCPFKDPFVSHHDVVPLIGLPDALAGALSHVSYQVRLDQAAARIGPADTAPSLRRCKPLEKRHSPRRRSPITGGTTVSGAKNLPRILMR